MNAVDSNADVPIEYRNVSMVRNKLPELKMANLAEDALFYIFYNFAGDVYQLAAASEL
jgi:CCR4-NOT transcriptional regulation complex NOT5 subunit